MLLLTAARRGILLLLLLLAAWTEVARNEMVYHLEGTCERPPRTVMVPQWMCKMIFLPIHLEVKIKCPKSEEISEFTPFQYTVNDIL